MTESQSLFYRDKYSSRSTIRQ